MTTPAEIVTPVLRRTPVGWLAVSHPDAAFKFAVSGVTEQEAITAYRKSYERWCDIYQRPGPVAPPG